jgi:hypothetical protein
MENPHMTPQAVVPRRSSAFGDLIALLFAPVVWLLRPFGGCKRAPPAMVKPLFYTPRNGSGYATRA